MNAYLAYICAIQGHTIHGSSTNTGTGIWNTHCARCGQRVKP